MNANNRRWAQNGHIHAIWKNLIEVWLMEMIVLSQYQTATYITDR
jgi:hypothetical protein